MMTSRAPTESSMMRRVLTAMSGRHTWLIVAGAVLVSQSVFTAAIRYYVVPVLTPGVHWQYGLQDASDSMYFHEEALGLTERMRANGWDTLSEDVYEGLSHTKIVAMAYYLTGSNNPAWVYFTNGVFAAVSAVLLCAFLIRIGVARPWAALAAIVFCVSPLFLFLHSALLREPYVIPAVLAYALGMVLLTTPASPRFISGPGLRRFAVGVLLVAIGFEGATEFRPYLMLLLVVGLAVATALLSALWVTRRPHRPGIAQVAALWLLVAVGGAIVVSNSNRVQPYRTEAAGAARAQALDEETQAARDQLRDKLDAIPTAREAPTSEAPRLTHEDYEIPYVCGVEWQPSGWIPGAIDRKFESLACARDGYLRFCDPEILGDRRDRFCDETTFSSTMGVIAHLPRAVAFGLLAPFPRMWVSGFGSGGSGLRRAGYIVDGLIAYALLPGIVLLMASTFRQQPHLTACCLGLLAIVTIYSMAVPTQFILARMRLGFYMPLLGFGAAGWLCLLARPLAHRASTSDVTGPGTAPAELRQSD